MPERADNRYSGNTPRVFRRKKPASVGPRSNIFLRPVKRDALDQPISSSASTSLFRMAAAPTETTNSSSQSSPRADHDDGRRAGSGLQMHQKRESRHVRHVMVHDQTAYRAGLEIGQEISRRGVIAGRHIGSFQDGGDGSSYQFGIVTAQTPVRFAVPKVNAPLRKSA